MKRLSVVFPTSLMFVHKVITRTNAEVLDDAMVVRAVLKYPINP